MIQELKSLPAQEKVITKRNSFFFITTYKLTEYSKPSFGSLPKVKTKDDLLKMLHTIRTDETDKYPEMEIEDWN